MNHTPRLVSWTEIENELLKIAWPEIDRVIAIARGGLVPAAWVAGRLNRPLSIIRVNLYEDGPEPAERSPEPIIEPAEIHTAPNDKILIVDDVTKSGRTLSAVVKLFPKAQLTTFVLFGRADIHLHLFEDCIIFPWTPT